jgi:hypothetical protein
MVPLLLEEVECSFEKEFPACEGRSQAIQIRNEYSTN